MKTIFLIRGISGCGKTTLSDTLHRGLQCEAGHWSEPDGSSVQHVAADDYFVDEDGVYKFDQSSLPDAHAWCKDQAEKAMEADIDVIVHNTFTQRWEMEPYLQLAGRFGYRISVVSLYDGGCTDEELAERNSHGVPLEGISRMRERYEHDWKNGDTRPPWERGG